MIIQISLRHVQYLPPELEPGILYVSKEFETSGHLCACGCGSKVITPLGTGEWSFRETDGTGSLRPSIGNWQLPCRSHYFITRGEIKWSYQWSDVEIKNGFEREEQERIRYFKKRSSKKKSVFRLIIKKIKTRIMSEVYAIKPGPKPKKEDGTRDKRHRVTPETKPKYPELKPHKHKPGDSKK